jgi:hypothetical protein
MEAQVKAWTDILTNTLQPKLQALEAERDAHVAAAGEYADLAILIGALRARRDAGGGLLEARCEVMPGSGQYEAVEVPDATRIHVDVGKGKFQEFPLDEALVQAEKRQRHFEHAAVGCREQVGKLQKDIWKGMSVVEQLQNIGSVV